MHITAELTLKYINENIAKDIQQSLRIDDDSFITSKVEDNIVYAAIRSKSLSSFLHTIDDYLSCLAVAEHIMEEKKKKKREIIE